MTAPTIGIKFRTAIAACILFGFEFLVPAALATESVSDIDTSVSAETGTEELSVESSAEESHFPAEQLAGLSIELTPAEKLRKQRRLNSQIQFCSPCHGVNGVARHVFYPDLAGKTQEYLLARLKHYKQQGSSSEIMTGMVAPLNDEDIQALASYYAEQVLPFDTRLAMEHSSAVNIESASRSVQVSADDAAKQPQEKVNP